MPRIIVTTEATHNGSRQPVDAFVLLDEQVRSVHLSTGHAATQLVERLAWAIIDAEEQESALSKPSSPPVQQKRTRASARRAGIRQSVSA